MPIKIIYLDDEPDICSMFVAMFASPDIAVETFTCPEKACKAIGEQSPDLVFLDYRLPGMTGEDVARRLSPAIPKALITGDLGLRSVGVFVKIFPKPFDFQAMKDFIQGYLDRKKVV